MTSQLMVLTSSMDSHEDENVSYAHYLMISSDTLELNHPLFQGISVENHPDLWMPDRQRIDINKVVARFVELGYSVQILEPMITPFFSIRRWAGMEEENEAE